ncbi:hypothetical protein ACNO8X_26120 [Mycobacterium sp. PDNC021]|uniref:hypothetical protein n=1 Tax=Mycobacterium sp. PDNC021 TaxID=3391399 RepID=UPI003AAAAFB8
MSTIPTTGTSPVPQHCDSCTVEVEHEGDLCTCCARHTPPIDSSTVTQGVGDGHPGKERTTSDTRLFDTAANYCSIALEDLEDAIGTLPAGTSMWVTVDLVRAQRYLRAALRVVEHAGTLLDAEVVAP